MRKNLAATLLICFTSLFFSCKSYYQFRMFETDASIFVDSIEQMRNSSTSEYLIEVNDVITLEVYTNGGERLVDPNDALTEGTTSTVKDNPPQPRYTIYSDGCAHLPMVGNVQLKGYTVFQADSILAEKYAAFYTAPYVKTKLLSKRVIVFGPDGGKVIPLEYQDMNLIEVIAQYGGIKIDGKANNIRVLRGDLSNPDVQLINLNTIEGLKLAHTDIEPGDIIYIEPKRRVFKETLTDIYPLVGITTSLATLYLLVTK